MDSNNQSLSYNIIYKMIDIACKENEENYIHS